MEPVARPVLLRPDRVENPPTETPGPKPVRLLPVRATYHLSDEGRKASLLAGGDGHAVQRIVIEIPQNRLHLVTVSDKGVARLKLRPRYELDANQQVICLDVPPMYDHPPTTDELLRQAARNHQLERAFHAKRTIAHDQRSDSDRERHTEVALAFLADATRRALVHPSPTSKRCFLPSRFGHLRFDVAVDTGPARDVPREAFRRFRADVKTARARRAHDRTQNLTLRDARQEAITTWIAEHGTADQQARHAVGLLSPSQVRELMANEAFGVFADRPRYTHDGVERMRAHVEHWTGRRRHKVTERDFVVFGHPVRTVSNQQWALLQEARAALPNAHVGLHLREYIWRRDPGIPRLTQITLVVTTKIGPVLLRREYVVADDGADTSRPPATAKEYMSQT